MEQDNWIQNILNSTDGMVQVSPSADLLSRIQQKINQQNKVSPKTVWLVAASIAVLVLLNFTVVKTKTTQKSDNPAASYLEETVNQSNQLY